MRRICLTASLTILLLPVVGCGRLVGPVVHVDLSRDYVREQSRASEQAIAATERLVQDRPLIAFGTEVEIRLEGTHDDLTWGENRTHVAHRALADGRLEVTVRGRGNHAFHHAFEVAVPPGEGDLVLDLEQETLRRR